MKNVHDNDDMMILSAAVYLPMSHHNPGLQQNIANTGDSVPNINRCCGAAAKRVNRNPNDCLVGFSNMDELVSMAFINAIAAMETIFSVYE